MIRVFCFSTHSDSSIEKSGGGGQIPSDRLDKRQRVASADDTPIMRQYIKLGILTLLVYALAWQRWLRNQYVLRVLINLRELFSA